MRVSLDNPQNADITGSSESYFQFFQPVQTTPLVTLGSIWRYSFRVMSFRYIAVLPAIS